MRGPSESFPLAEASIQAALDSVPAEDPVRIRELLAKAREMKGLADADVKVT